MKCPKDKTRLIRIGPKGRTTVEKFYGCRTCREIFVEKGDGSLEVYNP